MKIILENLRNDLSNIEDALLYEISLLKNNKERKINSTFTEVLKNIEIFDKIIQGIRKQQLLNIVPKDKIEQCKTAEKEWKRINNLVDEYDNLLPEYLKNHPKCGLLPIRKRINYDFQKSVKTKIFNY